MAQLIGAKGADFLALPGRRSREVIGADCGADRCTVRIVEILPEGPGDKRRGPHVLDGFEECSHVLAGCGVTRTDTGALPVGPGDTVLIPAGERHATYNTGTEILRLVCFFPIADIRPATREFDGWDDPVEGTSTGA